MEAAALLERLGPAQLPEACGLGDLHLVCHCEVCDALVVEAKHSFYIGSADGGGRWDWSPPIAGGSLAEAVGDHSHDDDLAELGRGAIRWYRLRAIGPWKDVHVTSLAEMLATDPAIIRRGYPVPSAAVVNDLLASSRHEVRRAGGIEFPPLQIDPARFDPLRAELLERCPGLVDTPVPPSVTTLEQLTSWWDRVIGQYPAAARNRYKSEVFRLGQALAGTQPETAAYEEALATINALMSNIITVLETYADD